MRYGDFRYRSSLNKFISVSKKTSSIFGRKQHVSDGTSGRHAQRVLRIRAVPKPRQCSCFLVSCRSHIGIHQQSFIIRSSTLRCSKMGSRPIRPRVEFVCTRRQLRKRRASTIADRRCSQSAHNQNFRMIDPSGRNMIHDVGKRELLRKSKRESHLRGMYGVYFGNSVSLVRIAR